MYHQLIHVFFLFVFFGRNEKGLLNFVSERIKLVYMINLISRYSFQKNKLPLKLLKPQFIGSILLICESPYRNVNYSFIGRTLKNV